MLGTAVLIATDRRLVGAATASARSDRLGAQLGQVRPEQRGEFQRAMLPE